MTKTIEDYKDLHKGSPGWVLGNSSSLNKIDNEVMRDKVTFVTNEALFKVYNANYGVTGDTQCYNYMWNYQFQTQGQFPEAVFFHAPEQKSVGTVWIDTIADVENGYFSVDLTERIVDIGSPVYLATQLAVWMGCNPIFMLGNDLGPDPITGQTHFWGSKRDYWKENTMNMGKQFNNVLNVWRGVIPKLNKKGIYVFSCSTWSKMNEFTPYMALEEALKM